MPKQPPNIHVYFINGEKHLTEQSRLVATDILARDPEHMRGTVLAEVSLGKVKEPYAPNAVIALSDKPIYFVTEPRVG